MDILVQFLPIFYLHSNEQYNSMLFATYRNHCEEITQLDGVYLSINDVACKYGRSNELQVFAGIVNLTDEDGVQVTDLVYYLFFPYNGPMGPFHVGSHWYDMEHVTLRFRGHVVTRDSVPFKVLFSIHSSYKWFDYDSPILSKYNKHLEVFVARNSHACYPRPGTYLRYMGFANDHCNRGTRPQPSIILYNPTDPIFAYKSVIGLKDTHNLNRDEFKFGEVASVYNNSITSYCCT